MISVSYFLTAALLFIIWTIYRIIVIKKNGINKFREIIIGVFFIYFLAVVYFTFFKNGELMLSFERSKYVNIIPIKETVRMFTNGFGLRFAIYNVFGNILLFMPLGFFIPLLFKKCNSFKKVLLYGFCASLTIETIQFFTAINISDIDDVIFNTLGAGIGLICFRIFYKIIKLIKAEKIIVKVADNEHSKLLILSIKPIGIMLTCFTILYFILLSIYS